jgi:DNA-binding transcriptional MerR regulator
MNIPRKVLNGFTPGEVRKITGLSVPMIDYLAREGYLLPTYAQGRVRGRVRYYSYRDLLVARIVRKLLKSGLEIARLKASIKLLNSDATWFPKTARSFDLLATDGKKIYYHDRSDSLIELTTGNLQRTFAFVLDVSDTREEVRKRINNVEKRRRFTLENLPLLDKIPGTVDRAVKKTKNHL